MTPLDLLFLTLHDSVDLPLWDLQNQAFFQLKHVKNNLLAPV